MNFDDLKQLGKHLENKGRARWTEHNIHETTSHIKPKWTETSITDKKQPVKWSTKNYKKNLKKLGKGFTKAQGTLRTTFPGIADGSWEKQFIGSKQKQGKNPWDW